MRIYELAKELGVENKNLLSTAQDLGMSEKKSHSNSLSKSEENKIRRAFARAEQKVEAESANDGPKEKTLSSKVDESTGKRSNLVERRSGNVVRRRRTVVTAKTATAATPVSEPAAEPTPPEISDDIFKKEAPRVMSAEEKQQQLLDQTKAAEAQAASNARLAKLEAQEQKPSIGGAERASTNAKVDSTTGPVVLGKIKLNNTNSRYRGGGNNRGGGGGNRRTGNSNSGGGILSYTGNFGNFGNNSEGSDSDDSKRKKGRVVEFSSGDLIDYNTNRRKRNMFGRGGGGTSLQSQQQRAEPMGAVNRQIKLESKTVNVGDLAAKMSLKSGQVIAKLIELGVMATINQPLDIETATILAEELGYSLEFAGITEEDLIQIEGIDDPEKQVSRSPVVTVMGHVDHGKTSLLDYIRTATVASKEHGGITQHIGAYVVERKKGQKITFIDTPGHAAFTEMRARGADLTDIVILVVAADDGVMPQTLEALNHAQAAGVPIIVAVNKMDKEGANPEKIKSQLAERGLQPEDWGGDTMFVPVSALTGAGMDDLLDGILLVAEVAEFTANPTCRVRGTVIEVRQEQGRGTVATVLVQAGTLNTGDTFLVGANFGKVRSMMNHLGKPIKTALPSTPVEITGFDGTPEAGDDFIVMENETKAKEVATIRQQQLLEEKQAALAGGPISLEEFAKAAANLDKLELRVIVKADVSGSLEAVRTALQDLSTEEIDLKVLHSAVGGVSESDIQLAMASKTIIVGFNVRGEPRALLEAENNNIEVRFYRVIYELIDDIRDAMSGMLSPDLKEEVLGHAEVRETFSVPKFGTIGGCYVTDGNMIRGAKLRLLRDSAVVYEGEMGTLRRFKDDVKEVKNGFECGISIAGFNDLKVGDRIEAYKINEVERTL